jgi:HK97 family phage prohead protease
MEHKIETLNAPFELLETQPEEGTFKGRAAVYGRKFDTMFGSLIIEPGAFTESLKADKNRHVILWQHNERQPIGRPIELEDGPDGLDITGKISETTQGKDALILLRDKVVREMSIGLDRIEEEQGEKGKPDRLKKGKIWEFSLVTFGAAGAIGAKVKEVHKAVRIVEPPLEVMRARVLEAELEEKFGKLPGSEPQMITVERIAELCPLVAEKLTARGIESITVEQFVQAMDSLKLD